MFGARRLAIAAVFGLVLALPGTAEGAITVNNTNDSGPGSLRQAILDAPAGETIIVPAGTYTLNSGELTITKSLTISGHGAADTIIRAGGPFRLLAISGATNNVTISGLTLRDGHPSEASGIVEGGGVLDREASLDLRNDVITSNVADANGASGKNGGIAEGGGIAISNEGSLILFESSVISNTASATGGSESFGGIAEGGGLRGAESTLTIERSTFEGNLANAAGGQGPTSGSQFGGISEGGGVSAESATKPSNLLQSSFVTNVADAAGGPGGHGGIGEGGGVSLITGQPLALSNVTIAANAVRLGDEGGVGSGGGLYSSISGSNGSVEIADSTLSANSIEPPAGEGGDIFSSGKVSVGDTVVSAGRGAPGSENCEGEISSLGFNLDSADQCGFHSPGDQIKKDPLLGPLQANGGPTPTMAPSLGSPLIDQGRSFGFLADQRGAARPVDFPAIPNSSAAGSDGADIGAFELHPSNAFSFGKLTRNRKKGTATLALQLSLPLVGGTVALSGNGVKSQTATAPTTGALELALIAIGKVKKALQRRGKRKVAINVTYTPVASTPLTQGLTVTLFRKQKHHRKGHRSRHGAGHRGRPQP